MLILLITATALLATTTAAALQGLAGEEGDLLGRRKARRHFAQPPHVLRIHGRERSLIAPSIASRRVLRATSRLRILLVLSLPPLDARSHLAQLLVQRFHIALVLLVCKIGRPGESAWCGRPCARRNAGGGRTRDGR